MSFTSGYKYCKVCERMLTTRGSWDRHLRSASHQRKVRKSRSIARQPKKKIHRCNVCAVKNKDKRRHRW